MRWQVAPLALPFCLLWQASAFPLAHSNAASLLDISISDLSALLQSGAITSYDLVELYFQRIEDVNAELNAVIEISQNALDVARQRDDERAAGNLRGPLHGIPILVKDNYATTDDLQTGAGSVCLAKARPWEEATVIVKLRQAGAIIIGKTNQAEFSGGRGSNSTAGWSPRGGQTFGAYVQNQTACGSSSGSGVSASLGLAAGTLGTETAGSITCPAFMNNVVGIKPTVGLTSRYGVVPLTARQDTTGPLTQSVADAALILEVIAGKDPRDNYTLSQPWSTPPRYTQVLNASALEGKRIGVIRTDEPILDKSLFVNYDEIQVVFDAALISLEVAGAQLVNVKPEGFTGSLLNATNLVQGNMTLYGRPDYKESLTKYLDNTIHDAQSPQNLTQLIECIRTDPSEEIDRVNIDSLEKIAAWNKTADGQEAWEAYNAAKELARTILLGSVKREGLDAIVTLLDVALIFAAPTGLPIVTVPMGSLGQNATVIWDESGTLIESAPGMPLGLSFVADRWEEEALIGYAYAFEQVSKARGELKPWIKPGHDLELILRKPRSAELR
ncbi:amidase signature domain-containing protein [Truncatella angustata]|uniref:Amidase signature domain-containing protein n=1 Tax=Truncatella angustata TaxID=152316 RepID=A0A9P8ULE1_9PEZI|nr:amidase signature domain-containing protein [Truncatella angustata]KAH6654248.1 amidase signature domain-containing protein [Truncatella angustata]